MTGIIDVGGGMKCAYSAGLYDCLMDNGVEFDYYLGVSAGSMNLLSYMAGERGRNIEIYRSSSEGDEYLSISNLVHYGAYMNYDKVREDFYSGTGSNPFNFDRFFSSNKQFVVSATEAQTCRTVYFSKDRDMPDRGRTLDIITASCCIPLASKPISIYGIPYFDGGVAEPIPYLKAMLDGCNRIVVVLSAPADQKREKLIAANLIGVALKDYEKIGEALEDRHVLYNYMIKTVKELERHGIAIMLSPEEIRGTGVLIKNIEVINQLYENGYRDGMKRKSDICRLMESGNISA